MISNRRSKRVGGVLVETALVLPLFLSLVLLIIEMGTVFFVRHSMLNAARDSVRSYSIGEMNSAETVAFATTRLPPLDVGFAVSASSDTDATLDRWVEIRVPLREAALNDPLGLWDGGELTVRVTMRRED